MRCDSWDSLLAGTLANSCLGRKLKARVAIILFSTNPENLVLMLQCMDIIAERFAMRINAAKTKVMSVGKGDS
jgi:hypothetical protein